MLVCSALGALVVAEELDETVAQLVHVEVGGVDDDVGAALQLLEQRPLRGDALGDAVVGRERVLAAGRLVAAHEHVVGRVEEQHPGAARPSRAARRARRRGRRRTRRSARRRRARTAAGPRSPRPSSATLAMSAGGRLSITKKPRSSSTSAAAERPAPDMPVMMVTSRVTRDVHPGAAAVSPCSCA